MSSYIQVGHDSHNLLSDPQLGTLGAILSPVNYTQSKLANTIKDKKGKIELIFDPQLYFPKSQMAKLRTWNYVPCDVDSADYSQLGWWSRINKSLTKTAQELGVTSICSPAFIPRTYTEDFYELILNIADDLAQQNMQTNIGILQTVLVNLNDLARYSYVMAIASVLVKMKTQRVYLIFVGSTSPRLELADPDELKGAMLLISLLVENNFDVLVAYSSSDLVLWKTAGATSVASGKFFNLRRFTESRWDEKDEGGGGQQAYWIEESLMAFLRTQDVSRVAKHSLLSKASLNNPFAKDILQCINTGAPWLGLSWRFYLSWFGDIERRLDAKQIDPIKFLEQADKNWLQIELSKIYLDERRNDGAWLRQWLRAISEYQSPW